jgi:serine protease Do
MKLEQLTRSQFILLILLVTFVSAMATAIVTVTLMEKAPVPVTQTINRVVEKTIEKAMPLNSEKNNAENKEAKEQERVVVIKQEELITELVRDVSPAVVSVIATKDLPVVEQYFVNPFGDDEFFKKFFPPELLPQFQIPQYRKKGTEKRQISSGTGFFVSKDGLVLTNKHVVFDPEADYSIIINDGRKLKAEVLARDPFFDIAILKTKGSGFKHINLGDSSKLKVGQTVIAIGNALGEFQNTVSVGVISGLDRTVVASGPSGQEEMLQGIIQTDAAINPGNSGGPLISLDGTVVGINTAMAQGAENVGFALPINIAKKDIADAEKFGKVRFAFLGVRYLMINGQVKEEKKLPVDYGILLTKGPKGEPAITKDSPADKAGLKEGDIILEFDGKRIDQNNSLTKLISVKQVGEKVKLKVLRNSKTFEVEVTLDERP